MRRAAKLAAAVSSLVGRTRRSGAAVFAYHDVMDEPTGPYHVTPGQLEMNLQRVVDLGWRFAPLSEIVDLVAAGGSLDGVAAVTFDDGRRGIFEHALPILSEARIAATIFTIAGPGKSGRRMDDEQLRDVIAAGCVIGSHSRSHRSLRALDDEALREELRASRADLEARLGTVVDLVAYPSGHFDARVCREAAAAGYRAGFTFINGKITADDDVMRLPRLNMGQHVDSRRLAFHLARGPEAWPPTQLDELTG
jgi:peptidoglycan/xylan/chitin deacetylase (PgdA/CDA1 family)